VPPKTSDKAVAVSLIVLSGLSLVISCTGYALLSRNSLEAAFWFTLSIWVLGSLPLAWLAGSALPAVKRSRFFWIGLAGIALSVALGFGLTSLKVKSIQGSLFLLLIAAWICAPTPAAVWLGAAFVRAKERWFLVGGLILIEGARLWFYCTLDWGGRLAGLVLLNVPLHQYIATSLLLAATWVIGRGRIPRMLWNKS
jgi:hypothetical protein